MIKNDKALAKELEKFFDMYRQAPGSLGEIIQRWENYPEGDKILKSLVRQEKEYMRNNPANWRMTLRVNLVVLFSNISIWLVENSIKQFRPKERKDAIDRIRVNAMRILEDFHAIGLTICSNRYFTQEELFERYQQMFKMFEFSKSIQQRLEMFDLPDELSEPSFVDFNKDIKPYLEFYWESFPNSEMLVSDLLMKLTDDKLLDKLAPPAIVSKTESENFPRVFMVRKLAQWFAQQYGKELHNTIANLCVLIFDDTSIDKDTVRSALAGFEVDAVQDWRLEQSHFIERMGFDVKGGKKPWK